MRTTSLLAAVGFLFLGIIAALRLPESVDPVRPRHQKRVVPRTPDKRMESPSDRLPAMDPPLVRDADQLHDRILALPDAKVARMAESEALDPLGATPRDQEQSLLLIP